MGTTTTTANVNDASHQAKDYFWPHGRRAGDVSKETGLQIVTGAHGVWVEDANGEQWFDTLSGLWLVNIGHGRKEIADAVYQQMQTISFSPNDTVSPVTAQLSAKLAALSPDQRSRSYFVSGGSEAVETALKMAKHYHRLNGQPTRWKVISRRGSYHGSTLACTSLGRGCGGQGVPVDYGPLVPGNIHIATPGSYRCHFCANQGGCNLECARDLDRAITHEGAETVAAFIGEPISAASGIHVPHPEYWPTVREICDRHGVIMICDEVITGFGRSGKMFATEHWDVTPDIRTVAKGLTSGYLPIGAVIAAHKIADAFIGATASPFSHLITFGGNPPACAAALANLEIMEGERMVENSATMGEYLLERLQSLGDHPLVGEVRGGLGLLCALEIVKDKETRERFPKTANLGDKATRAMRRHNMLGRAGDVIPLAPPLCITRDEIDHAIVQLGGVLADLEKEL